MLRNEEERPVAALSSIGLRAEDIQYILLVSYANANVALFPNVKKMFISRRGWIEDFFAPPIPGHVPPKIFMPDDVVIYLTAKILDRKSVV